MSVNFPANAYKVKIEFISAIAGSIPASERQLYWAVLQMAHRNKAVAEQLLEKYKEIVRKALEQLQISEQEKDCLKIFRRDEEGYPVLSNHQIKGYLKTAVNYLDLSKYKLNIQWWDINKAVHVEPVLIRLYKDPELKEPVKAEDIKLAESYIGTKGARNIHEVIEPPVYAEFTVYFAERLKINSIDIVKYLFSYGEIHGVGGRRNDGFGRFRVIEVKEEK